MKHRKNLRIFRRVTKFGEN